MLYIHYNQMVVNNNLVSYKVKKHGNTVTMFFNPTYLIYKNKIKGILWNNVKTVRKIHIRKKMYW